MNSRWLQLKRFPLLPFILIVAETVKSMLIEESFALAIDSEGLPQYLMNLGLSVLPVPFTEGYEEISVSQ